MATSQILEEHGHEELTMRRRGAAVGIRAPSLYKHFPVRAAVEVALIEEGIVELAAACKRAPAAACLPVSNLGPPRHSSA